MKLTKRDLKADVTPRPELVSHGWKYWETLERERLHCLTCPHEDCVGRGSQLCPAKRATGTGSV